MKQTSLKENSHRELLFQEAVSGNLRMDLCARGVSVMTESVPWDTHTHTHSSITHFFKNAHHTLIYTAAQSFLILPCLNFSAVYLYH